MFKKDDFLFIAAWLVAFFVFVQEGCAQTAVGNEKQVVLQGSISLKPSKPLPGDLTEKIQPGTAAMIDIVVENIGTKASMAGELYVRYALAHPLNKESTDLDFATEKRMLPSIEPGKKVEITFETPHLIPSLLDFVRDDWSIREYQAVAVVNHQEYPIGTLAITFSAYYYPGLKKEIPASIKSMD